MGAETCGAQGALFLDTIEYDCGQNAPLQEDPASWLRVSATTALEGGRFAMQLQVFCLRCGKAVSRIPSSLSPTTFCSPDCFYRYQTDQANSSREARFWALVLKGAQCWLWQGTKNPNGYGHMRVQGHFRSAHRLAWEYSNGPIPPGLFVCHTCDTPLCMKPDHLFLGTHQDNMKDMARKGRGGGDHTGSHNGRARLTEESVIRIREQASNGVPHNELADLYRVTEHHIDNIVAGRAWRIVGRARALAEAKP